MTKRDIEIWASKIIELLAAQQHSESAHVELKGDWPDPGDAARGIAAQANAAGGEPILYLIGVDERRGVIGCNRTNLADWHAQLVKRFDGAPPDMHDVLIMHEGKSVMALQFDTNNTPYVITARPQGQISYEVPWRSATGTRSAKRAELLRLLLPIAELPEIEILRSGFSLQSPMPGRGDIAAIPFAWSFWCELFIVPTTNRPVVIPFHQVSIGFSIPVAAAPLPLELHRFGIIPTFSSPKIDWERQRQFTCETATAVAFDAVHGAATNEISWNLLAAPKVKIAISLGVAGSRRAIILDQILPCTRNEEHTITWGNTKDF